MPDRDAALTRRQPAHPRHRALFEFFRRRAFACALNGHPHVGYRFQPANAPLFVSAPSATMGCRSGVGTFYWRLEASAKQITSVRERPFS